MSISETAHPDHAGTLERKSMLLSDFFDHLSATGAVFCVMNNYADLPRRIPSDVDMAVDAATFNRLDALVSNFGASRGAFIVQKLWHGYRKCAYILSDLSATNPYFIQLDFFVDFSTRFCPLLLSFEDLINDRRRFKNFYIPNPDCEIVFIAMRRIFKDDWSSSHCDRIAELSKHASRQQWIASNFPWLVPVLKHAVAGRVKVLADRQRFDWKVMMFAAWRRLSVACLVDVLLWQIRRLLYRLTHDTGNLSVFISNSPARGRSAQQLAHALSSVFYRFFIGSDDSSVTRKGLLLAARMKLAKLRKSIIIIPLSPDAPSFIETISFYARWKLLDQVLVDGTKCHAVELGDIDVPVHRIHGLAESVRVILESHVKKTSAAISSGRSQTSGAGRD